VYCFSLWFGTRVVRVKTNVLLCAGGEKWDTQWSETKIENGRIGVYRKQWVYQEDVSLQMIWVSGRREGEYVDQQRSDPGDVCQYESSATTFIKKEKRERVRLLD